MDSQPTTIERIMQLAQSRRFRAFGIAVLVLSSLVVLQVGNLNQNAPMCALINDCNLNNSDLHRMQIALSQSGLTEFRLTENRLLVPTDQHAIYLQAIADKNAIPKELRDSEDAGPSLNPFLSRSQQLALERAAKKRQIRDMVVRLPFVDQAWFEMDQTDSHSAFGQAKQSAVISIRTPQSQPLVNQHVDTVKRMIGGAVAGLAPQDIVVIDLESGYAHQEATDPATLRKIQFQHRASEQQRHYEMKIRETLKDYPGITVQVHVAPADSSDKMTSTQRPELRPAEPTPPTTGSHQQAGANTKISLADFEQAAPASNQRASTAVDLVSHDQMPVIESRDSDVSVSIDVPQKLVFELFGKPSIDPAKLRDQAEFQNEMANDVQRKFEQLQSEIIQKVRPILPTSVFRDRAAYPISVNLIRQPFPTETQWLEQAKQLASQHWPSAMVLIVGLMLLSIVTKNPQPQLPPNTSDDAIIDDVLAFESPANESRLDKNTEARLSNLIEKDPDAAAKIIEAWIRDAA